MKKKPLLMALLCFGCPLLEGLFSVFGLALTWTHPDAVFALVALAAAALAIFGKADDSALNARCSLIMPAFCALGCLYFLMENIGRLSVAAVVVILISAWSTARPHLKGAGRRLLAVAAAILPAGLAVLLGVMGLVLGDFGATYTAQALPSPDGTLAAVAVEVDEGALGGSARVEVRRTGGLDLGVVSIGFAPETVWEGGWMPLEEIGMEWRDGGVLVVNGTPVSVANP